jgi:hypothetical protein
MSAKHTGSLYQLPHKRQLAVGAYVAVNGPHDTYGVVLSSALKADGQYAGLYIHRVRGVPKRPGDTPVAEF